MIRYLTKRVGHYLMRSGGPLGETPKNVNRQIVCRVAPDEVY
jgi:hypothetical protein